MNPLCCIAPVSLERERGGSPVVPVKPPRPPPVSQPPSPVEAETSVKGVVGHGSGKQSSSTPQIRSAFLQPSNQDSLLRPDPDEAVLASASEGREERGCCAAGNVAVVAGVLYKWVNYGKGWRSRWFVLQDGVLSYYKVHGPDKITVGNMADEKGIRVIGEDSLRRVMRDKADGVGIRGTMKQWKAFGEIHLKVSSVRASKSDDKRLSIYTGTKTLHLRCLAREDRNAWIDALLFAKDLLPRALTSSEFSPSEDVTISTEKLRSRLLQEGLSESIVSECESVMLSEFSGLQSQLFSLQRKHLVLLDTLRQLETEKAELEATVVDETKERESYAEQGNGRLSGKWASHILIPQRIY